MHHVGVLSDFVVTNSIDDRAALSKTIKVFSQQSLRPNSALVFCIAIKPDDSSIEQTMEEQKSEIF